MRTPTIKNRGTKCFIVPQKSLAEFCRLRSLSHLVWQFFFLVGQVGILFRPDEKLFISKLFDNASKVFQDKYFFAHNKNSNK